MTNPRPADRVGKVVVETVPYVIVAVVAGFTVTGGSGTTAAMILLAALVAWMLALFTVPRGLRAHPWAMAVYVAGVFVLACALTAIAPWYGVLALVGYVYSFAVVTWPWQLLSVSAFAALAAIAQSNGIGFGDASHVAAAAGVIALNIAAICLLTWVYHSMRMLAEERRIALEENERLREELLTRARDEARSDERRRLAREIHDTVAQGLVGVITQLEAIDTSGGRMPTPDDVRHLEQASAIARESLREARRAVAELAPAALDGADLTTAVRRATDQWGLRTGTTTRLSLPESPQAADPDVSAALLRVLQEALANVARHAGASLVSVTLTWFPDAVAIDIADDGAGFDADVHREPGPAGGYGLTAMGERLARIGGALAIESEPGRGTIVSARAPLHVPDREEAR